MTNERYEALLALCQGRRCRREFVPGQPLAPEQIEQIRAVALTSPYASGKKNWEIMVVTDPEVLQKMVAAVDRCIEETTEQIRSSFRDDFVTYAQNFTAFARAPAVFVPTFRVAPSLSLMCEGVNDGVQEDVRRWERDNYVKSISCVGMLVLLAAESLGLAACYMTGPLLAEKVLGELIGIKPGRNIGALIPVGYRDVEGRAGSE